jgi:hypothetical protein
MRKDRVGPAMQALPVWVQRLLRGAVVRLRVLLRGERALYFLLFVLTGVIGGVVGAGVHWLGAGLQTVFLGSPGPMLAVAQKLPWAWRLVAPAAGALAAGVLIHIVLRGQGGGGVTEVMEAVALSSPPRGGTSSSDAASRPAWPPCTTLLSERHSS